jgi:hypothetical protein
MRSLKSPTANRMASSRSREKIPLLTYYSPSHRRYFENFFKPSFDRHLAEEFELVAVADEQRCKTGLFRSEGWQFMARAKLESILAYLHGHLTEDIVMFSDVDVLFFRPIRHLLISELGDADIAFQSDNADFCTGLFVLRNNARVRDLFRQACEVCDRCDQIAINQVIPQLPIKAKFLSEAFFSIWRTTSGKVWFAHLPIRMPDHPIAVYHANFTSGTGNKMLLLRYYEAHLTGGRLGKMRVRMEAWSFRLGAHVYRFFMRWRNFLYRFSERYDT